MSKHVETAIRRLISGPCSARQLADYLGVSQPTVSRVLSELKNEILRFGSAQSIQYVVRDSFRGLPDLPVYRIDVQGKIRQIGVLIAVRPDGFVMRQEDGATRYSDGIPWWLFDMRPQGYLGRAYAARHGKALGLPEKLTEWTDTHALRALLTHGHDVVGNLLLGDAVRDHFLALPVPAPISEGEKAKTYAKLAKEAAHGEIPGSSAGGEQPKFTAFAEMPDGLRHVIVKFTESELGPVSERWRDILLAEHVALETLRDAGFSAATACIIDDEDQRFLEVERFDRIGAMGRRAVFSLGALDAEFVGEGSGGWPTIVQRLAADGHIHPEAADQASLLWAFGTLIGNTDMHNGNLSFVSEHGRPYSLAPAYDMTPMAFAPRAGGGLPDTLPDASIHASVPNHTWRRAEELARAFLNRVEADPRFSRRFSPCIATLGNHIETARVKIGRLG